MKHAGSYPVNSSYAFAEINERIKKRQRRGAPEVERRGVALRRRRPPECFSELVDDRVIRAVFEDQNAGSYSEALKCAASGHKSAHRAFRKILNAVESAYLIDYFGNEFAPKPRVLFLHRNLLEIADLLQLSVLRPAGIMEFLDDLCPCGRKHKSDATRKLIKRSKVRRRTS
jgi:hypothetical protein